jgi:type IV secretory pathway VirB10-like protein
MIPLAAIEGKLIFWAVAAAVGVINWWLEKKKKESQSGSTKSPAPSQKPAASGSGDSSEQERLRRFLEALGVPQPPQQAQPRQPQTAPQQPRPKPAPASLPHPVQRQVAQPIQGRMQGAKLQRKPQQQITRRPKPLAVEREEMHRAGRIEEAASSIERISGEFETMNVRVDMPPVQKLETPGHLATVDAGTTSVLERGGNPLVASLRRTLTNPTDIRAAFLAAELLGPPKALQR